MREPAPMIEELEKAKEPGERGNRRIRKLGEPRGGVEVRGEAMPTAGQAEKVGELEETEKTGELESAIGVLEEVKRLREPVIAWLLSWSACLQALTLAATRFSHCLFFFNCLVLS